MLLSSGVKVGNRVNGNCKTAFSFRMAEKSSLTQLDVSVLFLWIQRGLFETKDLEKDRSCQILLTKILTLN